MSDYNHITLVGYVTTKPETIINVADNTKIVRFMLEVERDAGATDLIQIRCAKRIAEIVLELIDMGKKLLCDGSLYITSKGTEGWECYVLLDNVQILTPMKTKRKEIKK